MKYTKAFIFVLLVYIQIGCETDKRKTNLLGIWESFETHHPKNVLTFYKDSLILDGFNGGYHANSRWEVDDSKIYLKNVRLFDSIINKQITYDYELNKSKDTLLIRVLSGNEEEFSTLKKVEINPFTSDSKQINKIAKVDTLAIWGDLNYNHRQAMEFVAEDWNLAVNRFPFIKENSNLPESYIKEKNEKNKIESQEINRRLWGEIKLSQPDKTIYDFRKQVDFEFEKISLAQNLFDNNINVQDYLKKTYKKGQFIIPIVKKKESDSIYIWYLWKIYEDDDELATNEPYAEFFIDLKDETIFIKKSDQ